jgi:hypothetical protein
LFRGRENSQDGIDYWTTFPSDGVGSRFQFQDHANRLLLERIYFLLKG